MHMDRPEVSIIVAALLPSHGIGNRGKLPWRLKKEMKYFREVTTKTHDPLKKNMVVMGRNTYESIPVKFRPLKGRVNVVLSRDLDSYRKKMEQEVAANGSMLQLAGSLDQALLFVDPTKIEEIFIIGGAQLYKTALDKASHMVDRILLTEITSLEQLQLDTFLALDSTQWEKRFETELSSYLVSKGLADEFQLTGNHEGNFQYDFTLWKRKT
ncbi:hypothetical protein FOA43_000253 [Brettanomyces nanus]|uniref:Dihydrofolate reductase n=1 Tax=Eeniella nana TaxID=13502 RepID=A0A875RZ54_EENNA|nr:uncharacterized protein FOA43_000253 [Brettanomyces nanus]QPG72949.1 hypothetical protein FOA43_000253 [Brettanomyces nanus]